MPMLPTRAARTFLRPPGHAEVEEKTRTRLNFLNFASLDRLDPLAARA